jgi:hypothetical protein
MNTTTCTRSITSGRLIVGERVAGVSEPWGTTWEGVFDGIRLSDWDDVLYAYFKDGQVGDTPQTRFGFPIGHLPTPTIADVTVKPKDEDDGFGSDFYHVRGVWSAPWVSRTVTTGYLVKGRALADRLAAAMEAGAVFVNPEVRVDVNGHTYVTSSSTVLARQINADLRRLGF